MKVAFVADTHFGYSRFEEDALEQGRRAILDAAEKADVIVLGGDIFDVRVPRLETLAEVAELLKEANGMLERKAGGKITGGGLVLGIHGTHERRGRDSLNPVQMMARLGLLLDLHNRTVVLRRGEEAVGFSGLGGIPDDLVSDALKRLSCKPQEGAVNFFIFHQTMKEYVPEAPGLASLDELPEGYDWHLCGHMHGRAEHLGGKLLIPGSTVITQLREDEAQKKGYYVIDTVWKKAEFVEIESRPFVLARIEATGEGAAEIRAMIETEISKIMARGWKQKPIIRIVVEGSMASSDAGMEGFEREDAIVYVEMQAEGATLAQEIEKLRLSRMQRATPAELASARLRENASKFGISAERADELYQQFLNQE